MKALWLVGALVWGCTSATRPESRAVLAREAHCAENQATVEVFIKGSDPTRPYKVIAPLAVPKDTNAKALTQRACALGAHAVIAVTETSLPADAHEMTTTAMTTDEAPALLLMGEAIVYTDSPAN